MTTEASAEPRIAAGRRHTVSRPLHPAAGSRTTALALSITATAGMMIAMVSANATATAVTTVASEALPPAPEATVVTIARPNILLPVPSLTNQAAPTPKAPVAVATPQPIKVEPQRRVVAVKSNGSR